MARHSIPDIIEAAEPRRGRSVIRTRPLPYSLVRSLRPEQWTKNLIIFGGLLFGQKLLDLFLVERITLRLVKWPFVPIETEPTHSVQDSLDRLGC